MPDVTADITDEQIRELLARGMQHVSNAADPATACGVAPSGRDTSWVAVECGIRDGEGWIPEVCPACRAEVERVTGARPLLHLSGRRGSITDAQRRYLGRLLVEMPGHAYVAHGHRLDRNHLEIVSMREACGAITRIKLAKDRGWKAR